MAILFLAAPMWGEAYAQNRTYSVSVSQHTGIGAPVLKEEEIRKILADASNILQKDAGHADTDDDVACNVTFTLKGPVRTFGSPDTPAIVAEEHIDAVHRVDSAPPLWQAPQLPPTADGVDFHIKVVDKIVNFCRFRNPRGFHGCSFPPNFHSIIVVHPKRHTDPDNPSGPPLSTFPDHILWAHEFAHLTGLGHRNEPAGAPMTPLMTPCDLSRKFPSGSDASVQVTRNECRCLLSGLGACALPGPVGCP
jgi:hypothetical protein